MRPRGTGSIYLQKGKPKNISDADWKTLPREEKKRLAVAVSENWWIQYFRNGKVYRESTGTSNRRKAERILQQKLGQIATGGWIDPRTEKRTLVKNLAGDLITEYKNNSRKSLSHLQRRWEKHLAPWFAEHRASSVDSRSVAGYVASRQEEGAENSTINRELAALKKMFRLGMKAKLVHSVPDIPHFRENNVRKGFVNEDEYQKLASECAKQGLWMRALFEVAYAFGWRKEELLGLTVRQVDLLNRTIRLEPGDTKNDDGRTVVMPSLVYALVQQCVVGKKPNAFVFTRADGKPVRSFRGSWYAVCCAAGVGDMYCSTCSNSNEPPVPVKMSECKHEGHKESFYRGLIFHDLRRTAVRTMVRGGIPERVAMTISGHKTRSVFDRYNIVSESDLADAAARMDSRREQQAECRERGSNPHGAFAPSDFKSDTSANSVIPAQHPFYSSAKKSGTGSTPAPDFVNDREFW